jgi:hypothetical protein
VPRATPREARVMIFFDRDGCDAKKITWVLVDRGYSAWPMDPPEEPGHVVLGFRHEPLATGGYRFALELRSRTSFAVIARSRYVTRPDPNIENITQQEAKEMVSDIVTSPAFQRIALRIDDDIASRFRIDRPDLSDCLRPSAMTPP